MELFIPLASSFVALLSIVGLSLSDSSRANSNSNSTPSPSTDGISSSNSPSSTTSTASSLTSNTGPTPAVINPCAQIENAFASVVKPGEPPICQCVMNVPPPAAGQQIHQQQQNVNQFWVGCTRHKMTAVFRTLQTLNGTRVPHLHIWDSLINILPNDPKPMFTQLLADRLTIEGSRVGLIREGAFANIGQTLRGLNLRHNILKGVEERAFVDLGELRELDLSWNKLVDLRRSHFARMVHLERLVLAGNQIARLEDGLFEPLAKLRLLNLANNNIKRITKNTFKGLANLEVLMLSTNKLNSIDGDAFVHLKALKVLELDNNNLSVIELRGNAALERLVLNNNSISDLPNLSVVGLSGLRSLQLDNNNITSIADSDLRGLARSESLVSLSLDGNNISRIGCTAFSHVARLSVLSLQHNHIASLSCSASQDPISFTVFLDQSFLQPLQKLKRLLLSNNVLQQLCEDDLAGLDALEELSLDHNNISKFKIKITFQISKNAFVGLQLRKLFLNNNQLYYLPRGVFAGWNLSDVQAVDLSGNIWECICEQEWIGAWLKALGKADTHSGSLGCLDSNQCENVTKSTPWLCGTDDGQSMGPSQGEGGAYDAWIRLVACVLAFVAILFLAIAGYVYMQESWHTVTIRRASSDTIRLIPSVESLFSLPNPIVVGNDLLPSKLQQCHPPINYQQRCVGTATSIAIKAVGGGGIVSGDGRKEDGKKRVRFQ
uniref:Leucine-rich repeat-containing protein 15 n=1 Tax=Globodera rostochiensis TaxID=31243 RepID=A0A914I1K1_GLORO